MTSSTRAHVLSLFPRNSALEDAAQCRSVMLRCAFTISQRIVLHKTLVSETICDKNDCILFVSWECQFFVFL